MALDSKLHWIGLAHWLEPKMEKNKMTPSTTGTAVTPIVTAIPTTHPSFARFMAILAALEPLVIAGVSPFVKNTETQTIVATESPLAQTLFQALANL